jgi:hypothetical protein
MSEIFFFSSKGDHQKNLEQKKSKAGKKKRTKFLTKEY